MNIGEKFKKKLLVEGKNDQHIVWSLCEKYGINENFDTINHDGKDRLIEQLPLRIKEPDIQTLGIIIDADTNIKTRIAQLKGVLLNSGIEINDEIPESGLIKDAKPRIAIWIMPDNKNEGAIEDFVKLLIPENDSLLEYAENAINEIENKGIQKYKPQHKSKALVHTWLAWQDEPGNPMGTSITIGTLDSEVQSCRKLVDWLKRTFE
jgi:hypothetical protein